MSEEKAERAHSKFSASGSERWLECPPSVALEEASPPSKDTPWSLEGTQAHELLECMLNVSLYPNGELGEHAALKAAERNAPTAMKVYVRAVYWRILDLHKEVGGELLVEFRVYNTEIHPEMFGTCDVIIVVPFKVLHIIDFKYGKNHVVSPTGNTQLIQYALGVAQLYEWNFDEVWHHIMQPRVGKDVNTWHKKWGIPITDLYRKWYPYFKQGVARVVDGTGEYKVGNHCYWCRGKLKCPARKNRMSEKVLNVFDENPLERSQDEKENNGGQASRQKTSGQKEKSEAWYQAQAKANKKGRRKKAIVWPA